MSSFSCISRHRGGPVGEDDESAGGGCPGHAAPGVRLPPRGSLAQHRCAVLCLWCAAR